MDHDPKLRAGAKTTDWRPVRSELVGRAARAKDGMPARQDQQYLLLPVWQTSAERAASASRDVPAADETGQPDGRRPD